MEKILVEIADDLSKYLTLDQLVTLSLVSTSSYLTYSEESGKSYPTGLNNMRDYNFIPYATLDINFHFE